VAGDWVNTGLNVEGLGFAATAGAVYDIALLTPAGFDRNRWYGEFVMELRRTTLTAPENSTRESAAPLPSSLPFRFSFQWPGGQVPVDESGMMHLWWKFSAPSEGFYRFEFQNWSPTIRFNDGEATALAPVQYLRTGETFWLEYTLFPPHELTIGIAAEAIPGPPPNDMVADAADAGTATTFRLIGHRSMATFEPDEPPLDISNPAANATGSLWWRWTSPGDGWLRRVSDHHNATPVDVFSESAADPVAERRTLHQVLEVRAGHRYLVRAGFSVWDEHTHCHVELDFLPYPDNLTPETAMNLGLTDAPEWHADRPHPDGYVRESLWFKWTAARDGRCDFAFSDMAEDATIYTDPAGGNSILPRDTGSNTWQFRAGQTYWLKYDSHSSGASFEMWHEPLTTSGDLSTAVVLEAELPVTATATTRGDVNSAAEVELLRRTVWHWELENGAPAIWWRWQSPRDQWVRCEYEVFNNGLNAFVILSGSSPATQILPQESAYDPGGKYFNARRGETYWFAAVGLWKTGLSSQFVRLDLRPVVEAGPSNDNYASSAGISRAQWFSDSPIIGMHRGSGVGHPLRYEMTRATLEQGEPPVSLVLGEEGNAVEQTASTWWHWTAPSTGLYKLIVGPTQAPGIVTRNVRIPGGDGDGTVMDLTVSLFTGSSLASLAPLMLYEPFAGQYCFRAQQDTRYFIRVASGEQRDFYALSPVIPAPEDVFDFWAIERLLFEYVGDGYESYARDGVPNYLKVIFNMNPRLPVHHPDNVAAAGDRLPRHVPAAGTLELRCRPDASLAPGGSSSNYFLFGLASTDLENWELVPAVALPGGELSVRLPASAGPRGFLQWDPFAFSE
jgi:hypothetical protein